MSDFFGEKAMAGVADPEEFTWSRVYGVVDTRPKWQEDRIVEVQLSGDCTEIIWVSGKIDATWLVSVHFCFCLIKFTSCVTYFAVNVVL